MLSLFKKHPWTYSKKDMDLVESYIKHNIGSYKMVLHEIASPDIHVDIVPIPPTKEKDYYTIVTMGMGAYRMQVPPAFAKSKCYRAEVAIRLPKDWDINSDKEEWYWPIRLLKVLARMPLAEKSWLGYGHSIDYVGPMADNTDLCAAVLDFLLDDDTQLLRLTSGDCVVIYNVVPIFKEEMAFKIANSAEALFDRLGENVLTSPINIQRTNCCLE